MLRTEKRRWAAADVNQDTLLDFDEFQAFLYPEEKRYMAELVAQETLETIDKNRDG